MIMTLRGVTPRVSPDAFIAETAALIGDVTVGKDSSVWFGAVIRGDTEPITVGEGTSIQDNCVLHTEKGHPLTVGSNVTVGHGAIVHCTSVGDNTMVGVPAKPVRELSPEVIAFLHGTSPYVALSKEYMK